MTPPSPILLAAREGFHVPGAESFFGRPIWELSLFGLDVSVNRTVILVWAAALITAVLFLLAFARPKQVPRGLQNVMEFGVDFVRNQIILPAMGPKGLKFLPYLTTLFFFIFFLNIFEIIPGLSFPPTSRLAVPLVLALATWVIFITVGIKSQGFGRYLKNSVAPPGVPAPVLLILVPVEFLSVFILRPVTLTIRLTANMIAGHMLLVVFFLGTAYLWEAGMTRGFALGSFAIAVGFTGFEIFVAGLQAFIFTILTAVYISGSQEPAH
jgi:F-type H+-transporting ATPase subunit a